MDTLIFLVSAAVVVTLGYGVFWTVRAIRRVGLRRFAGAVVQLGRAVLVAVSRLFGPKLRNDGKRKQYRWVDIGDTQNADLEQNPGFHVNYRTEELDDGLDPGGIYIDKSYNEMHY